MTVFCGELVIGTRTGDEQEIAELAWQRVWQSVSGKTNSHDVYDIVRHCLSDLSSGSRREIFVGAPNFVFSFDKGVRNVRLGPAEVLRSSQFFRNVKIKYRNRSKFEREIKFRGKCNLEWHGNRITILVLVGHCYCSFAECRRSSALVDERCAQFATAVISAKSVGLESTQQRYRG